MYMYDVHVFTSEGDQGLGARKSIKREKIYELKRNHFLPEGKTQLIDFII